MKYLQESFKNLTEVGLKIKVEKCAFEVTERKFLGYMITNKGNRPHLEKIQIVLNMKTPRTINDVQKLNNGIATLCRFIPRSANGCQRLLKLKKPPMK